jgi:chromosome segregation ATPase
MNQPPTREEFERLEQEQKRLEEENKEIKKRLEHIERHTEPIPATTRIEVASADVLNQLQVIAQKQDKTSTGVDELKLDAKAYVGDAAIFKNKVERMENDVSTLKTDMEQVKTDIDTIKTVQSGHSKFFEEHGKRLAATATKDDISRLETTMATKDDIAELKGLMMQLLQQKPPES